MPVSTPRPYRERLSPSPGVVVLAVVGGASLGLVLLPVSTAAALAVGAAAVAGLLAALVLLAPVVEVRVPCPPDGETPGVGGELRAGHARIPTGALGAPEVLDREAMRAALGPGLDARAWVCHRPWVGPGVRVPVRDPRDSTPYWLMSSRRPAALAAALGRAGDQAAHSEQTS